MIDPLAASAPHIKSGNLRALAVTTPQRNSAFPNIPTASEAGATGYDFASWGGLFAPANTPRAVVMQLNAEVLKALNGADLKKRFEDMGLVAKPSSPEEFGAFLNAEMNRWKGLVKKAP
jgi:tripartite-type tricarboxylate transporter receptor subunit TctC